MPREAVDCSEQGACDRGSTKKWFGTCVLAVEYHRDKRWVVPRVILEKNCSMGFSSTKFTAKTGSKRRNITQYATALLILKSIMFTG